MNVCLRKRSVKKAKKRCSLSPPSGAMRRIGTATATMMEWLNRQAEVALCRKRRSHHVKVFETHRFVELETRFHSYDARATPTNCRCRFNCTQQRNTGFRNRARQSLSSERRTCS